MTSAETDPESWKILIVDDEPEIHILTKTVLKGVEFEGKPLVFLSTYDGPQTRQVLAENPDIALILMDVIMEESNTGLELIRYIREDLGNHDARIILRTAHPGEAPERRIIIEYEINDYKEKVDLTSNRLFTSVIKSLRNYRDLKQIGVINNSLERSREGLTRVIESSSALFEVRSLEDFFDELIHQSALVMGLGTDLMIVESESGRVIRATGKNGSLRDGDIDDEDLHRLKNLAESRQARQTGNSPMVYHFSGIQGRGHLLVIDNHEIPDDEQLQLLEIFISNGLIVYAKMSLEEESKATQTEMIGLLGDIVEERDYREGELKGHIKRVSEYAIHLAGKLGYSREDLNILVDAVPLHDIGKIGIYDEVLMKPGRLTEEEFEHMKEHATIGWEILRHSTRKLFRFASIIALQHHERWDGTGYPRGLAGEDIHELGRITCIADVFDALSSDRVYRKAWSFEKTVEFLRDGKGTQFDPQLVDLFLEDLDALKKITARNLG